MVGSITLRKLELRLEYVDLVKKKRKEGWVIDGSIIPIDDIVKLTMTRFKGYGPEASNTWMERSMEIDMSRAFRTSMRVAEELIDAIDDGFEYLARLLFPPKPPKGWRYLSRKR